MGEPDIEEIIERLDEWFGKRNSHDVPGQGEADVVSLANILRDALVAIAMHRQSHD